VDEKLAFPAGQALHVEAPLLTTPVPTPISVTEPAAHVAHATIGAAEYVPEPHAMQLLPPGLVPVSGIDPAAHCEHCWIDELLYWPAAHAVQFVAPLLTVPVPVPHAMQLLPPGLVPVSTIDPAAHCEHCWIDELLYWPTAHAVQFVAPLLTAPVPAPTSAMDPAGHRTHTVGDDAALEYFPDPHVLHVGVP
jgi:hypothetical protein